MTTPAQAIATVDSRPYFERALCHARTEGLVDAARLEAIHREGAKGIVQLAAYFSTANLRPELEAARTRLVTLVGLALEAEVAWRKGVEAGLTLKGQSALRGLVPSRLVAAREAWIRAGGR